MGLDRVKRDEQLFSNLLVRQPFGHQHKHLKFSFTDAKFPELFFI